MSELTEECNKRHIQQDVTEKRLKIAVGEIKQLKADKLDVMEYQTFETRTLNN